MEDPGGERDEDDQQRIEGEEPVVGDEGSDPAAVVLAVTLGDRDREPDGRNSPLQAVDTREMADRLSHALIMSGPHSASVAGSPRRASVSRRRPVVTVRRVDVAEGFVDGGVEVLAVEGVEEAVVMDEVTESGA